MEQTDDVFANKGWILAKNVNGKIKVTTGRQDETNNFASMDGDNWITLNNTNSTNLSKVMCKATLKEHRQIKFAYKEITHKHIQTGFYLIRDLLNLQKPNKLSNVFLADGMPVQRVAICARISSVELKNHYYRLVVDDGTSAILCMVKKVAQEDANETIAESESALNLIHLTTTLLIQRIELESHKLKRKMKTDFDQSSLGVPVMIMGYLQEFREKNYIFAYSVRRVTEEYYVKFLSYIIQSYEHKENYMFDR